MFEKLYFDSKTVGRTLRVLGFGGHFLRLY